MKALVVDDSRAMRLVICQALASLDFETEQAETGDEALELLAGSPDFDAVVLDPSGPRGSGLACAATLRRTLAGRRPRVVLITSMPPTEGPEALRELGVDGVIRKPFPPDSLARLLAETLALRL